MHIVSAILSPIVVYLNHGNDHLLEGQLFVYCDLNNSPEKLQPPNQNVPVSSVLCQLLDNLFVVFFFNIMKTEINNKLVVGLSFTQPSLVQSRNASPHKRLLRIELHSFPSVFVVQRTNQSCVRNLTVREPQGARKRTRFSVFDKSSKRV